MDMDIFEELYTPRGSQSMVISAMQEYSLTFGLEVEDPILVVYYNGTYSKQFALRVSAVCNFYPIFEHDVKQHDHHVLVSLPAYVRLAAGYIKDVSQIPFKKLLIKPRDLSDETLDKIVSAL